MTHLFRPPPQRLIRAERNEYGEMWVEMLEAHERRLKREQSAAATRSASDEGIDGRRRVKRSQRLGKKALYGKGAKALAQSATFDPAAPGMLARMKALQPTPSTDDPVTSVSPGDLPPKPHVSADSVR